MPVNHSVLTRLWHCRLLNVGLVSGLSLMLGSCSVGSLSVSPPTHESTVTILGQLPPEDQAKFEAAILPFEEETGIDVVYETVDNFSSMLSMRVTSFNAPDLAMLPQPGAIADLAKDNQLVPLTDLFEMSELRAAYPDSWLDLGSVDRTPYGLWTRVSLKSLVWYNPQAFQDKGYDIPRSWNELMALSDQIVKDGSTPWCMGFESGSATGWPATDWIEDILLRANGPEAYEQWISHEMSFNSPAVISAMKRFSTILNKPNYVSGGAESTLSKNFGESALGLFGSPPDCYLHRQANFVVSFFPEDKAPIVDYNAFLLPSIDPKFGSPRLVAGDAVVMFNRTPASEAFMKYLATAEPHILWAGQGGYVSAHKSVPLSAYNSVVDQTVAQLLLDESEIIRFDGSDMMPGYVGTNLFWTGMADFINGKSAEDVAKEIDLGWP